MQEASQADRNEPNDLKHWLNRGEMAFMKVKIDPEYERVTR